MFVDEAIIDIDCLIHGRSGIEQYHFFSLYVAGLIIIISQGGFLFNNAISK